MLKIRRRFFLLVAVFGLVLTLASCAKSKDYVQLDFDSEVYYVKVGETWNVEPNIDKGANVEVVTLNYSSSNGAVATYTDGVLTGVAAGETTIKVVCAEKPIAYDVAKVVVLENRLPIATFGTWEQTMLKKGTQQITCKLKDLVPGHVANVSFASSDETVAKVATVNGSGFVTAVGVGETTITATVSDGEDSKEYTFNLEVVESEFAITYVLNGGVNDARNPEIYCLLNLPIVLQAPERENCEFLGWYTEPEFVNRVNSIYSNVGDITLYAKWYDPETVLNVTYELDGGEFETAPEATFIAKDGIPTLPTPTKLGYNFLGWYEGETKVDSIEAKRLEDVTLTAQWEVATFTINYVLADGEFQREVPKYKTVTDLANAFVADYAEFYSLTGVTPETFYGVSASRGVKVFFQNHQTEWAWLLDYIYAKAVAESPAIKHFFTMNTEMVQFNKYVRPNLMALFTEGTYQGEVASMNFAGTGTSEAFIAACPTVMEGKDAKTSITINETPYVLETPFKDGYEFDGWSLVEGETDATKMLTSIETATLAEAVDGVITLYANYKEIVSE